jgi:hypothetical protein
MEQLKVDFDIPDLVQHDIDKMVEEVEAHGLSVDCWQCEIRASINMSINAGWLTEEQGKILRDYYYGRDWYD